MARIAPAEVMIDLFADAPAHDPRLAAYLLAAYAPEFPPETIFLCIVDPGVGSDRRAALLQVDGRWFVGPDNGLFNVLAVRAQASRWWDIDWRPGRLSASFHGRDLFAPVAARLALGEMPVCTEQPLLQRVEPGWPAELAKVIYVDHYGNAMTGVRAQALPTSALLQVQGQSIPHARTFSGRPPGEAFWYENANGLVEIAVNQGRADRRLGVALGDPIEWAG